MTSPEGRLIGVNGSFYVGTSAQTDKNYYAIVPQEDSVFTTLSGENEKGETQNYLTLQGLASKTIKQGSMIMCPQGHKITAVTLSSGSAIAY